MTGAVFVAGTRACFRFFATAALLQSRTDGSIRKSVRSEEIASQATTSLRVAIGRPPARLLIGPGQVPPRLRREAEALEREAAEEPTRDVASEHVGSRGRPLRRFHSPPQQPTVVCLECLGRLLAFSLRLRFACAMVGKLMAPTVTASPLLAGNVQRVRRALRELDGGELLSALGIQLERALEGSAEATREYVRCYHVLTLRVLDEAQRARPDVVVCTADGHFALMDVKG